MLRPVLGEIEDVTDELGHGIGTQLHRAEELRAVCRYHTAKERFLVAEVRVQAFFARTRSPRDAVDARARQPILREFRARSGEDFAAQLSGRPHTVIIDRRTGSFVRVVGAQGKPKETL